MIRVLLILTFVVCSGCFPTSRFDSCEDDERLAIVGGSEGCFAVCETGCGSGTSCVNGVCVSSQLLLEPTPDPDAGNNDDVGEPEPVLSLAEAEALCQDVVDIYFGCASNHCTLSDEQNAALAAAQDFFLNGDGDESGCIEAAMVSEPFVESAKSFQMLDCQSTQYIRCTELDLADSCTCDPPAKLGNTCVDDESCIAGDFLVGCFISETGENPSGYCTSVCPDSDPNQARDYIVLDPETCGEGNYCTVAVTGEERVGFCLRGCTAQADCDGESACGVVGFGDNNTFARVCFAWGSCSDEFCDGRCVDGVCQIPCDTQALRNACNNSGGICEVDGEDEYCVLP